MKSYHILLCSLAATIVTGVAQTSLPNDALALQKSYREARQRALEPLQTKYIGELEKLLAAHTKAGRLDEAIAIKAELEAVLSSSSATDYETPLSRTIIGTKWNWDKKEVMSFLENGKASLEHEKGTIKLVWKQKDESSITVTPLSGWGAGKPYNVKFNSNYTKADITSPNFKPVEATRK